MRGRALRAVIFSAVAAVFLAGVVGTSSPQVKSISSAQARPASTELLGEARDAYTTTGYRWNNRTSVDVYSNWDGGACSLDGTNFGGNAGSAGAAVAAQVLQASIDNINASLGGGLVLVNAGTVPHAELCTKTTARPIVIGWGTLPETGRALSYGITSSTAVSRYSMQYARVFITNSYDFACSGSPMYRDLQHTVTHELLHAIGVGHSTDTSALMTPVSSACRAGYTLEGDDVAAVNALYSPVEPVLTVPALPIPTPIPALVATPTPIAAAPAPSAGTVQGFIAAPVFSPSGYALAVFDGGTIANLEAATRAAGATGVWVQDSSGGFQLLVVDGPSFIRSAFAAKFPSGFARTIAVTLVR